MNLGTLVSEGTALSTVPQPLFIEVEFYSKF